MMPAGGSTSFFLTGEDPDGRYMDLSSRPVLARRWGLGIFPVAQEPVPAWWQQERCSRESLSMGFLGHGRAEEANPIARIQIVSEEATR
jgi:hypothetical protein